MCADTGIRCSAFNNQNPRFILHKSEALQHPLFHALDIDFEPVDLAVPGQSQDVGQCDGGHEGLPHGKSLEAVHFCNGGIPGAHACIWDFVEGEGAMAVGNGGLDDGLVGPVLSEKVGISLGGFHMDASPAALVKSFAHGIDHRMLRADINIESLLNMPEGAPEHHIFKILRVRSDSRLKRAGFEFGLFDGFFQSEMLLLQIGWLLRISE